MTRPVDNPMVDEDGNVWYLVFGQWTMVEPTDEDKWRDIMAGAFARESDENDIRGRVQKEKKNA
jgi:hypothetical protein